MRSSVVSGIDPRTVRKMLRPIRQLEIRGYVRDAAFTRPPEQLLILFIGIIDRMPGRVE